MLKQVNKKFRTLLSRISKKPHNTKEGEPLSPADVGAITLRSIKLLSNALFVFLFLGGLFGAGIATGYALNLFNKVSVPEKDALIRQVQNISAVSKLTYSDSSVISSIDSDLIRVTVDSSAISENVKKAVIAT